MTPQPIEASDIAARVMAGLPQVIEGSSQLSEWALLTVAGALAIMFSTSYHKPPWPARWIYLLLLPAIGALVLSLERGFHIRQTHMAFLLRKPVPEAPLEALREVNTTFAAQIFWFRFAFWLLTGWLILYVIWWMFYDRQSTAKGEMV